MNNDIILYLPWPPTVNSYYKTSRSGHKYLDKSVGAFRDAIHTALHEQVPGLELVDPLFIDVFLFPPDKRKRDLDNYMKGLLDAITVSGLWEDDSQIDQLHIYRGETISKGVVVMEISEAAPIIKYEDKI